MSKIETIYFFCGKSNFPHPMESKTSLDDWKLFIKENSFPFNIVYVDDFEKLKEISKENPLVPVVAHVSDTDGFDKKTSMSMLSLKRKYGVRFFFLNCLSNYQDAHFADIHCKTLEEMKFCIEYLVKKELYKKGVSTPERFSTWFGFSGNGTASWPRQFVPIKGK